MIGGNAMSSPVRRAGRAAKLSAAGLVAAAALALAANEAQAQSQADTDGYVPTYSVCYATNELGFYSYTTDGYTTEGVIYINDCALQRLGAGPNDRQRVLEHEWGHAIGLPHSSDPSHYMYPYETITGT